MSVRIVAASVLVAVLAACGAPTWGNQVEIDYDIDGAQPIQQRLQNELHPGDGIVVQVNRSGSFPIVPAVTNISSDNGSGNLTVVTGDGWLDQKSADVMVGEVTRQEPDHINRIVLMIDKIHDWQATHARPPAPPPPPKSHLLRDIGLWGLGIFGGLAVLAFSMSMAERAREHIRDLLRQRHERRELLRKRSDEQTARLLAGDLDAIYGDYPPVNIGE